MRNVINSKVYALGRHDEWRGCGGAAGDVRGAARRNSVRGLTVADQSTSLVCQSGCHAHAHLLEESFIALIQ